MPFTLNGKSAIVTGAGRGIGRAIAGRLASAGAYVTANDLHAEAVQETVNGITSSGGQASAIAGDLTNPEFPNQLVDAAVRNSGGLDIIVNNAGFVWDSVIQKTTDEQFQAMLDIHLVAPFRILRAAAAFIREAARRESAERTRIMRKVVNITSIAGLDGGAGQASYGSAKAGVVGLTKTLAKEWGRYNVNVNAVGFGLIDTRLTQSLTTMEIKGRTVPVGVKPEVLHMLKERCPLGRLGTAEEAANAVLFFCSPLSDYVTGEVLVCGGGLRF